MGKRGKRGLGNGDRQLVLSGFNGHRGESVGPENKRDGAAKPSQRDRKEKVMFWAGHSKQRCEKQEENTKGQTPSRLLLLPSELNEKKGSLFPQAPPTKHTQTLAERLEPKLG